MLAATHTGSSPWRRAPLVPALAALTVACTALDGTPAAGDGTVHATVIDGEVVAAASRWTGDEGVDRGVIVTESTVIRPDGSEVTLTQLGGTVDGIGMWASHHPPLLEVGRRVRTTAVATGPDRFTLRQVLPGREADRDAPRLGEDVVTARYGVNRTMQTGTPLYWASGCIHLAVHSAGSTHIPSDIEFRIFQQAADEWQAETQICSGLSFSTAISEDPGVGRNRVNSVVFREDRWCRPATATQDELCHNPNAIAVTQVFFVDDPNSPRDGTILEADIEYNGVDFALAVGGDSLGVAPRTADLLSTTTHELGHVLGLSHNCWNGLENRPSDHQGLPVPECNDPLLSEEITEATMYFQQEEGETKKASLESSDVLGVCAGLGDLTCDRVVRGGCSVTSGRGPTPWTAPLLLVALAWIARRRRPASR